MTLRDLKAGQSAVIEAVGGEGATRQHFLDMGVIPGAEVTLIKFAPMGDPMELRIHGYELTLRLSEAEQIDIRKEGISDEVRSETDKLRARVTDKNDSENQSSDNKTSGKKTSGKKASDKRDNPSDINSSSK